MVSPIADFVVSLRQNGRINSQGTASDALSKDSKLLKEVTVVNESNKIEEDAQALDGDEPEAREKSDGKLVAKEEIVEGQISLSACMCSLFIFFVAMLTLSFKSNYSLAASAAWDSG